VINATGVVLHTNLGARRSPPRPSRRITRVAQGYSAVEYDLGRGTRGLASRDLRDLRSS